MAWYPQNEVRIFEQEESIIEGLFFLNGNSWARLLDRDVTKGQKYPQVYFPFGEHYEFWDVADVHQRVLVSLFGVMALPYFSMRCSIYARDANCPASALSDYP